VERAQQRTLRAIGFRLAQLARRLDRQGVERTTRLLELRVNRMQQRTDELDYSSRTRIARILSLRRERRRALDARLRERDLSVRLAKAGERWRAGSRALGEAVARRLGLAQRRLEPLAGRLEALSPLKVLERGYSIVQTEDGRVVKRANDAPEGASIRVRLHEGRLTALVRESRTD
jgi:exodeoxyribonuclease VII large subunit